MNVNMANILMLKVLPSRTKSVRFHIELEDDAPRMTTDEFWEFCQANRKFRSELTKDGELNVMPPTGFETSDRNLEILLQLGVWAKKTKPGKQSNQTPDLYCRTARPTLLMPLGRAIKDWQNLPKRKRKSFCLYVPIL